MTTTATDDFDLTRVPRFPTVPVRTYYADDGSTVAELDGEPVELLDGNDPFETLIGRVQTLAARRPLQAIRVAATDPEDRTWRMVVHADGRRWDLDAPAEPAGKASGTKRPRRMVLALALSAGGLLFAAGATYVAVQTFPGSSTPEPTAHASPTPTPAPAGESPVVPVDGWVRRAAWHTPPVLAGAGVLVTSDHHQVITVGSLSADETATSNLVSRRPDDGAVLWSSPIPGGSTPDPPIFVRTEDGEAIAVQAGAALHLWPIDGAPSPTYTAELSSSARLVPHAPVPLLHDATQQQAQVLVDGQLAPRVLPAGARPVWADTSGTVTAVDDLGHWWHLTRAATAPSPSTVQPPDPSAQPRGLLGVAGRTLLYRWTDAADQTAWITGHALERPDLAPIWTIGGLDTQHSHELNVSPNGEWSIFGNLTILSETGQHATLPDDWRTDRITDEAAWSVSGQTPYVADRQGNVAELSAGPLDASSLPLAVSRELGLITAARGGVTHLWALERDQGTPYGPLPTETMTPSTFPYLYRES